MLWDTFEQKVEDVCIYCAGLLWSAVMSCFFSCVKKSWPEGMRCDMLPAGCYSPLLLFGTESPWTLWYTDGWSVELC
jgi:hypothetical protein